LVLHGPSTGAGLYDEDWEAWQAMEDLAQSGKVKRLGVSNCSLEQVQELYEGVKIKPRFLQNRCYARSQWDRRCREFCRSHDMIYQGCSLLPATPSALASRRVQDLAQKYRKTIPQVVFRFCLSIQMLPLTGTTSAQHLREDLDVEDFELSP